MRSSQNRPLKRRIEEASGAAFNSLLLNRYRDGTDSIGGYVLTQPDGGFHLSGTYTCTPNTQVSASMREKPAWEPRAWRIKGVDPNTLAPATTVKMPP